MYMEGYLQDPYSDGWTAYISQKVIEIPLG